MCMVIVKQLKNVNSPPERSRSAPVSSCWLPLDTTSLRFQCIWRPRPSVLRSGGWKMVARRHPNSGVGVLPSWKPLGQVRERVKGIVGQTRSWKFSFQVNHFLGSSAGRRSRRRKTESFWEFQEGEARSSGNAFGADMDTAGRALGDQASGGGLWNALECGEKP